MCLAVCLCFSVRRNFDKNVHNGTRNILLLDDLKLRGNPNQCLDPGI